MADPEFLAEMEKLRVLVVDDEEELRHLLQEILRDIGIVRVHLAENGEMAWQRLGHALSHKERTLDFTKVEE